MQFLMNPSLNICRRWKIRVRRAPNASPLEDARHLLVISWSFNSQPSHPNRHPNSQNCLLMSTPGDISKQSGAPRLVVPPGSAPEIIAEAFSADERIHFSTVTRRWTYEDESGAEWEYESAAGAWLPVVSDTRRHFKVLRGSLRNCAWLSVL